jgi:hypothetical protein
MKGRAGARCLQQAACKGCQQEGYHRHLLPLNGLQSIVLTAQTE